MGVGMIMSEQRNMDDVWERKDKRISKQNAINNSTNFVTACIQAGVFKPKDLEKGFDAIKEYMDKIFTLTYETGMVPSGGEEKEVKSMTPKTTTVGKPEDTKPSESPMWVCHSCKKEIISKRVAEYSMEKFGVHLCYDCQNKPEKA
jgi:hypothetical protein